MPKLEPQRPMISLDTETTGIDFLHGTKPFFVTSTNEQGETTFWEWDVDPLTRQPIIPPGDVDEIMNLIFWLDGDGPTIVGQNIKFDVKALATVCEPFTWPWDRTEDTLNGGHLLGSNLKHDLTSMVEYYLGDLGKVMANAEKELKEAVKKARGMVQRARMRYKKGQRDIPDYAHWNIADKGKEDMPSAKSDAWKNDMWLPRAMARHGYANSEPTWVYVLREYSNADSFGTIKLWERMKEEIIAKGHWKLYREKMRLPSILYSMESHGVTINHKRIDELKTICAGEVKDCNETMVGVADLYDYKLEIPKGSTNGSLRTFCFDHLELEPVINRKAKTSNPTLDKQNAIPFYLATLPQRSMQRLFIESYAKRTRRNTALTYLEAYHRYSLPLYFKGKMVDDWYRLHPTFNQTGTATVRLSSSNPNGQNISRQESICEKCEGDGCAKCNDTGKEFTSLRYCFGPAIGREWWSFDASNIELRIPAYESGQQEFIDLFERPNDAPYFGSNHLLMAHIVYPREFDGCRDEKGNLDGRIFKKRYGNTLYKCVKNGDFAVQYGAVDREDGTGTADLAYGVPGAQARLKSRFYKQEEHNQWCIKFAEKHGYIETIPDKEVDPDHGYPLLCTRTTWGKIKPTVPLNYRTQGTAGQWMARAMVKVAPFLDRLNGGESWQGRKWKGGYHMILQVHDELDFDFPRGRDHSMNLPVAKEIKRLMESCGNGIDIPTPVSVEYMEESWSSGLSIVC